jgi:hypothetical protein
VQPPGPTVHCWTCVPEHWVVFATHASEHVVVVVVPVPELVELDVLELVDVLELDVLELVDVLELDVLELVDVVELDVLELVDVLVLELLLALPPEPPDPLGVTCEPQPAAPIASTASGRQGADGWFMSAKLPPDWTALYRHASALGRGPHHPRIAPSADGPALPSPRGAPSRHRIGAAASLAAARAPVIVCALPRKPRGAAR